MNEARFDAIMAVILANLCDEFTNLSYTINKKRGEFMQDVSDFCGDAVMLAGANVNSYELEEFANEFTARYKLEEDSPAIQKINAEKAKGIMSDDKRKALAKLTTDDMRVLDIS